MPTLEEIGQKTKAKYPEYAGKSDLEVGQAVVKKYPEYQSSITSSDKKSGAQKVADFMGLGTTLKNITTIGGTPIVASRTNEFAKTSGDAFKQSQELIKQAKSEKDPAKKKALLDQSRQIMQGVDTEGFNQRLQKDQETMGITEKDLGRSNAEFAIRRGAGQTAELASYALPGAVGGPTTSVGQRFLQSAGKGAISGGLQGVASASGESENIIDALARTGTGAVVGAGTGAVLQGAFETVAGVKNAFTKTAGKAKNALTDMYRSTLKDNIKDQKFYQQYGGEEAVLKDSIKYNVPATKNGVNAELSRYGKEYNRTITEEAAKLERTGKKINISQAFNNAKARVKQQLGYDQALLDQANSWFDKNASKYANQTSAMAKSANNLRINLDRKVGDIITQDAVGSDAARKAFATELRMAFKEKASQKTKDAIQKYHLLSGLSEAMQKEPKTSLPEMLGAIAGGVSGGTFNLLNSLAGLGASKAIRSPGLKRVVISGLSRASSTQRVVPSAINPSVVVNPAVSALQRALDNTRKAKTNKEKLP